MKACKIIDILEKLAPQSFAESWDNPGLLVGRSDQEVTKVYIALDATQNAVEAAIAFGAQMIITHHPMIFSGIKQVNDRDFIGRKILMLIEHHMCCYAMHTNFDVARMADLAASCMGLKNIDVLDPTVFSDDAKASQQKGIGCIGALTETITLAECAKKVKNVFDIPAVKFFGDPDMIVTTAAICPGSGKSYVNKALSAGADVYITGDIDHHTGIDAAECGLAIIDAGHHGIEHIFMNEVAAYLKAHAQDIEIKTEENISPFRVI